MMAAVAVGVYTDIDACISDWVQPYLGPSEAPDPDLTQTYDGMYKTYRRTREVLPPVWADLANQRAKQRTQT